MDLAQRPYPVEDDEPGRPRGRFGTVVLAVPALALLAFCLLRLLDIDGSAYIVAALALTPYVAVGGLLWAAIAMLARRWVIGWGTLAVAAILVAGVVPRMITSSGPQAVGPELKVLTANLYFGQADAATVVDLVRRNTVDVLSLQELTPDMVSRLDAAGLAAELPYRVFAAAPGAGGSGLASRYPLRELQLTHGTSFAMPSAEMAMPRGTKIEFVAVHTMPPVGVDYPAEVWKSEVAGLPGTSASAPLRVLAGDFNATLDHATLRKAIAAGNYADAGDARGSGLAATWPAGDWPPPVTIDHVLIDFRCAVRDYRTYALPGGDHHAVLATLALPA